MMDGLRFFLSLCVGMSLGFVFFWGLWLTIAGLDRAEHPARRVIVSFLLRCGIVITGFSLIAGLSGWQHVIAGVVGFVFSRILVIRGTSARRLDTVGRESDA